MGGGSGGRVSMYYAGISSARGDEPQGRGRSVPPLFMLGVCLVT